MISRPESRSNAIWWICLVGFAIVLLTALRSWPQIADLFLQGDGDDQMRLVAVRDWLGGQGWFDTRQYRILPPEGISMHWSRYVDTGIAAFLIAASWVLPTAQAELAAITLWPSFLACCMILIIAHGTCRLFGAAAAVGALVVFLSWGKLAGEFVPGRIDHHNVQILCSTAMFFLSLVPGRRWLLGALAGGFTALALAVGLEMLPFLAMTWAAAAIRYAFDEPQAGDWLLGFAAAILLAAPLLFVGQTPPAEWWINNCDELGPPVLYLAAIGVLATTVPVLGARVLTGPVTRLLAMFALSGLGLWLAAPILETCLAGPYSDVPPEVREIIESNINEAFSASMLLARSPILLAQVLLPPLLISVMALATAWHLRRRLDPVQTTALIQAFCVAAVGFVFATQQIRAANLIAPAVPLLAGFLLYAFMLIPRTSLTRVPVIVILLLTIPTVVEHTSARLLLPLMPKPVATDAPPKHKSKLNCRTAADMATLARLPRSTIFSTVNLGPAIIAYTPHAATSAAYHRSTAAYWNGLGAIESKAALRDALASSGADYLVLCYGSGLEIRVPYLQDLLFGNLPAWLTDMSDDGQDLRLFQVDKARLAGDVP